MELVAVGRTAEVFAWGPGRVCKLDRPEWDGLSVHEAAVLTAVGAAGLPVPEAFETVVVDGRRGVVLERIDGPLLAELLLLAFDVETLALEFADLQRRVNETVVEGLPDVLAGVADGLRASRLPDPCIDELLALCAELDDGRRGLCHFDLHPYNVIVASQRWVVIDWLTAASGPPEADVARTLVLGGADPRSAAGRFNARVRRAAIDTRGFAPERLDAWVRVIAGARIAEGFEGAQRARLVALATGEAAS